MNRRQFSLGLLMLPAASWLGACAYPHHDAGYGPPPHAPAHGYRYKHRHGVHLVYDAGLAVYVVAGLPYHYYHGGHFYRFHAGIWELSGHPKGPWRRTSARSLPPGLSKKGPGGGPPHRGQGHRFD